ncbi:unnamed protein product [Phytophthora lilii]|uniref:Unnamed protein product n=1 Tax=Phytophthora lilii TaxID=2077276 RepID=A0A9W6WSC3_9STRA|nr:unnamed protein product [Phytophthora lilii]
MAHLPIRVAKTKTETTTHPPPNVMLYKPHTPMELGDAVLGQLTSALVFVFDHMVPAVHSVVSWETDDIDLGPIVPVCRIAAVVKMLQFMVLLTFVVLAIVGMGRRSSTDQQQQEAHCTAACPEGLIGTITEPSCSPASGRSVHYRVLYMVEKTLCIKTDQKMCRKPRMKHTSRVEKRQLTTKF